LDAVTNFVLTRALPVAKEVIRDFIDFSRNSDAYYDRQGKSNVPCGKAALFGLMMATMLMVLGIPGLRRAGVDVSTEFLLVGVGLNWMLLVLYGGMYWLGGKILFGRGGSFATINSFFFLSVFLLFLKVIEIPTRSMRFSAMVASCTGDSDFAVRANQAISGDRSLLITEFLVFAGYLVFFYKAYRMQRGVHEFGRVRGFVSMLVGSLLLIGVVSFVQEPGMRILVCGYVKAG
jgi:hypothetical protein